MRYGALMLVCVSAGAFSACNRSDEASKEKVEKTIESDAATSASTVTGR
jgi:hypothetical protein